LDFFYSGFSPFKLGQVEKNTVEEAIMICLKIVLKLLPKNTNLFGVIGRVFDPKIPFYHGTKNGYNFSPGFPAFRINAARKFQETKGFALILDVLKKPDCIWPGSEVVLIILNTLNSQEVL
jgi:hypothetical protein